MDGGHTEWERGWRTSPGFAWPAPPFPAGSLRTPVSMHRVLVRLTTLPLQPQGAFTLQSTRNESPATPEARRPSPTAGEDPAF